MSKNIITRNLNTLLLLSVFFILLMLPDTAWAADNVFSTIRDKAAKSLKEIKVVVYIIGGFGLIGFAFMAVFNKISWKWFANIAIGLFLVSAMGLFVDYFVTKDGKKGTYAGMLDYGNYLNPGYNETPGTGGGLGGGGNPPPNNTETDCNDSKNYDTDECKAERAAESAERSRCEANGGTYAGGACYVNGEDIWGGGSSGGGGTSGGAGGTGGSGSGSGGDGSGSGNNNNGSGNGGGSGSGNNNNGSGSGNNNGSGGDNGGTGGGNANELYCQVNPGDPSCGGKSSGGSGNNGGYNAQSASNGSDFGWNEETTEGTGWTGDEGGSSSNSGGSASGGAGGTGNGTNSNGSPNLEALNQDLQGIVNGNSGGGSSSGGNSGSTGGSGSYNNGGSSGGSNGGTASGGNSGGWLNGLVNQAGDKIKDEAQKVADKAKQDAINKAQNAVNNSGLLNDLGATGAINDAIGKAGEGINTDLWGDKNKGGMTEETTIVDGQPVTVWKDKNGNVVDPKTGKPVASGAENNEGASGFENPFKGAVYKDKNGNLVDMKTGEPILDSNGNPVKELPGYQPLWGSNEETGERGSQDGAEGEVADSTLWGYNEETSERGSQNGAGSANSSTGTSNDTLWGYNEETSERGSQNGAGSANSGDYETGYMLPEVVINGGPNMAQHNKDLQNIVNGGSGSAANSGAGTSGASNSATSGGTASDFGWGEQTTEGTGWGPGPDFGWNEQTSEGRGW